MVQPASLRTWATFVRLKSRFFALACILRVRRAQRLSTLAKGHRRRRRAAVSDDREHGATLVWGFCCQALFVGFIFILSFSSFLFG